MDIEVLTKDLTGFEKPSNVQLRVIEPFSMGLDMVVQVILFFLYVKKGVEKKKRGAGGELRLSSYNLYRPHQAPVKLQLLLLELCNALISR